jgi:hypothetical protein
VKIINSSIKRKGKSRAMERCLISGVGGLNGVIGKGSEWGKETVGEAERTEEERGADDWPANEKERCGKG